ncbi:hypothetical protein [Paenibacillus allorhizoplanae]|nr:hypothetical protein [Paenibacillus allorhizoplanae]
MTLVGSIPVSVDTDNCEIVVTNLNSDLKLHMPVATFQLPAESKQELKTIGHEYTISNDDGNYGDHVDVQFVGEILTCLFLDVSRLRS